jgi:serine/threonine protein kinase
MPFDWDLLKPGREITDAQKSVVEEIGLTFLKSGTGTPVHKKKLDLGSERRLLNDLEQLGLIRNHWNNYYPTFPALYFLPHSFREGYVGYLHYIFEAIKVLFERRGPGRFQMEEVDQEMGTVLADGKPLELAQNGLGAIYFERATSFLRNFQQSVVTEDSQRPGSPVGAVIPTDQMYEYVDLQKAWKLELARNRPAYMEALSAPLSVKEAGADARATLESKGRNVAGSRDNWETIGEPLGAGGQSTVYLVRGPKRVDERSQDIETIHSFSPWGTVAHETRVQKTGEFAEAVANYAREEVESDLGAMKVFKVRGEGQDAERLRQEIEVLQQNRPGLPKLLDLNLEERWIVTELFSRGTLEQNHSLYTGDVRRALKAFLSLVKTVEALHADGIIHRDIKPANVFVREDDQLVLGDFGIVFLRDQPDRVTLTNESVGPHDYMPPWAEVDGRLRKVDRDFDVYMLGKLLWCMVSGRLRLQREYFDRPENDVTVLFKERPEMYMIDVILRRCVVERAAECKTSASDLAVIVSTFVHMLERGGQLLHLGIPRPCRVCGHGHYQDEGYASTQPRIPKDTPVGLRLWVGGSDVASLPVYPFVCDTCGHVEFFTRGATRPSIRGSID